MRSLDHWLRELHHANNRGDGFADVVEAIRADALGAAVKVCEAAEARHNDALHRYEHRDNRLTAMMRGSEARDIAMGIRSLLPPTTTGGEGV